ncbi:MAG: hypothetical protein VKP63_00820 [Cyanobacteriota bacterium]|nr:hypothetical protein [Cyanobacteriota bacterium]
MSLAHSLSSASPSSPAQGPATGSHARDNLWRLAATTDQSQRDYRLIDGWQQPHPHLDGLYDSVEEALADAVGWLESQGAEAEEASIGLEVSTPCGSWRTIRQPDLLLCPLPQVARPESAKG